MDNELCVSLLPPSPPFASPSSPRSSTLILSFAIVLILCFMCFPAALILHTCLLTGNSIYSVNTDVWQESMKKKKKKIRWFKETDISLKICALIHLELIQFTPPTFAISAKWLLFRWIAKLSARCIFLNSIWFTLSLESYLVRPCLMIFSRQTRSKVKIDAYIKSTKVAYTELLLINVIHVFVWLLVIFIKYLVNTTRKSRTRSMSSLKARHHNTTVKNNNSFPPCYRTIFGLKLTECITYHSHYAGQSSR